METITRKELLELALIGAERKISDCTVRLIGAKADRISELCDQMAKIADIRKQIEAELNTLTDKEV